MTFSVARISSPQCGAHCPEVVVADGVIEPETPGAFVEFARRAAMSSNLRGVILLNSPGGNVAASMELGTAFRRLRLAAIVAGYATSGEASGPIAGECYSACVYALMGAVKRVAPPLSHIALHRMSVLLKDGAPGGGPSRRFADAHLVAVLARYAAEMGVSPAIVYNAESLPPDHIHLLSRGELRRSRLATSQF